MADAFVCGYPISHSRSPLIHGHWLETYGLAGSYSAIAVAPDDFGAFIGSLAAAGYVGGNVTIPHKETAFRLVDRLTPEAQAIGAVNTIWFEAGVLWGTNTDAYGFLANLDDIAEGWDDQLQTAVVIGAGGAARAVAYGLIHRGFQEIRILNRTAQRARDLAKALGPAATGHELEGARDILKGASLVVNTTALGMYGDTGLPVDLAHVDPDTLVTDIVYVPVETPFLAEARRLGLRTADGLGMLLHQAVPGFELWFGRRPLVDANLRRKILSDIEQHA